MLSDRMLVATVVVALIGAGCAAHAPGLSRRDHADLLDARALRRAAGTGVTRASHVFQLAAPIWERAARVDEHLLLVVCESTVTTVGRTPKNFVTVVRSLEDVDPESGRRFRQERVASQDEVVAVLDGLRGPCSFVSAIFGNWGVRFRVLSSGALGEAVLVDQADKH